MQTILGLTGKVNQKIIMSLDHSEKTTFNFITPTWNTDELVISDHACKVILYLKIPNVKYVLRTIRL